MTYLFDAAFAAFLIVAAVQDARRREVEHWTVLVLLALALAHMVVMADYAVLITLLPSAALIGAWYVRPSLCGAADIKVIACFLLYTGFAFLPLLALIASCILALSHLLITGNKGTPFCAWLGACGAAFLLIKAAISAHHIFSFSM